MLVWARKLLSPPVFSDEDKTRKASLLNAILLTLLAITLAYGVLAPLVYSDPASLLAVLALILVCLLAALGLMHLGRVQVAGALFLSAVWLAVTYIAVNDGGLRSTALSTYVTVIVAAGLLLGTRVGLTYAMLSVLAGLVMLYVEKWGILPPDVVVGRPVGLWIWLTVNCILAAVVLHLAVRSINSALDRARRNEHTLYEANAGLQREYVERERAEEKYSSLFRRSNDGILIHDLEGNIIELNRKALQQFGYTRSEGLALKVSDLHPPGALEASEAALEAVSRDGSVRFEIDCCRKSGRVFRAEISSALFTVAGERLVQRIVRDITSLKRAEQLFTALNSAAVAMETARTPSGTFAAAAKEVAKLGFVFCVFLTDESSENLYVEYISYDNRIVRAIEQLVGLTYRELRVPIEIVDAFRKVVREGETVFVADADEPMRQLIPEPGKPFAREIVKMLDVPKSIDAPLMVGQEVVGVLSVQSDDLTPEDMPAITAFAHQMAAAWHRAQLLEQAQHEIADRTRAEEALRESEERYRHLFSRLPIGLYRTTPAGKILDANPALVNMLGYPDRESLLAVNASEVFVSPSQRVHETALLEDEGVVLGYEIQIRRYDGKDIWARDTVRTVYDDRGLALYYEGSLEDVTERRRLEEQFRQAQKMEAVGRLAGGLAHDFNNLLTAIQGYTSLLLEEFGPDGPRDGISREATCSDLQEIERAADRAAELTSQLLAFSRRQVLQPKLIHLNELVRNVEKMLCRLIGEDIELRTALDPTVGQVKADPSQVEQVILNLAVNARDAMPHGGVLTLETANVRLDDDYVRERLEVRPGPYVMLAVTDTGVGMDERVRSHLFEPFFTTKEPGKGTGLGLATVYGIVKQTGGDVWVDSELGHGTVVRIYLPQVVEELASSEPEPETAALPGGQETVLLAEDEEVVRELARRVLERQGYKVLIASHPDEALRLHKGHADPIHLLITDVVMPGIGGRGLAELMLASRQGIKVLYISGYAGEAIAQQGVLDAGDGFLQKPFTPASLAQKVREALDD
jgi:PAS domain S-box-containing protein